MKELKFRARDKEEKVMREVAGIHWGINAIEFYDEELDSGIYDLDNYDVLQYIEQKDKNGNEIYEDDIVMYCNKSTIIYMKVVSVKGVFLQSGPGMFPGIWYDWDEVEVMAITPENLEFMMEIK